MDIDGHLNLTVFGRTAFPLIRSRIRVVETGEEFLAGFQLFPAQGHRPGHAILKITSSEQVLLHIADTVGHPLLMEHPDWHWYADARDEQAEKDKALVLNWAVSEQAVVFGSHLPFPGIGRVVVSLEEGWCWQPIESQIHASLRGESPKIMDMRIKLSQEQFAALNDFKLGKELIQPAIQQARGQRLEKKKDVYDRLNRYFQISGSGLAGKSRGRNRGGR